MAEPKKKRTSRVIELLEQQKQDASKSDDTDPLEGIDEAFGLDEFGTPKLW